MRILYASTTPVPSFKANSIQTIRTANALAAAGVDTTVLAGLAASPDTNRSSPPERAHSTEERDARDAWRARTAAHYELHEGVRLEAFLPGRTRVTLHRRYVSAFVK